MTQNLQIKQTEKLKLKMEKLINLSEFNMIFKYALRDLRRNYKKISSIIVTLFISSFCIKCNFYYRGQFKKRIK